MICEPFDVVEVPFPFSDVPKAKRRKALVLSSQEFNKLNGNTILMMLTSAKHSNGEKGAVIMRKNISNFIKLADFNV